MERNKTLTLLTVVLVGLLAASAWVFFTSATPPEPEGPPRFLQCSECSFERPYVQKLNGTTCQACKSGKLHAAHRSLKDSENDWQPVFRSPLALGLLSVTALLAAANGYVWWRRVRPRRKSIKNYLYCRCPKCKRKVRYVARVMQRTILCPTCRRELYLPPPGAPARTDH
jgi:hypothetical protein